jgi:hypothetical protein
MVNKTELNMIGCYVRSIERGGISMFDSWFRILKLVSSPILRLKMIYFFSYSENSLIL